MDFPGRFADRIMPDKIHRISLSFLVDKLAKQFGGTAGNIAYTLRLLDVTPVILSVAGNDFAPYESFLKSRDISTGLITVVRRVTTSAYFVVTDREDNQIGSFYTGATKYYRTLSVADAVRNRNIGFAVLAPTDPAAMRQYVTQCRTLGLPYLYDPAFQIDTFSAAELKSAIKGAAILIGNDYEISLIEQKLGISHEELILYMPVLITTLGSKGSVIETRKKHIHIRPAKPVSVSDPTGAGDAYRAGFLAGYVRGYDLVTCGQMGSVAAVYTVEKYGTVTHKFTSSAFTERYRLNYGSDFSLSSAGWNAQAAGGTIH
ncbi:hypothetical protein A2Z33_01470 [Candidatus Gottesmanbacteria bacterium RBG_16_52_11]|uniref:Carbohydrate kinase PfkB domain-containing protein n=1 Tax=Candidatus Gottesmanbacteria bacterium RBG_16_52_11 TaxID=1798374 RepID=A0A1F5YPN7_9BACT|nr:MAG: hypothetical protein A2Z33_01470 [Candidatus Gottesmanbacteria bacterium RBG_16_52_11]